MCAHCAISSLAAPLVLFPSFRQTPSWLLRTSKIIAARGRVFWEKSQSGRKKPAFRAGIRRTLYKFVDMFTNLPPEPLQREVLRPFLRAFKA
jgi:hypothetical protein